MTEQVQQAYIHILEAENARLQKENAILAKTSDYQYWTEEGSFFLKMFGVTFNTKGKYSVKISLCMGGDENHWYDESMDNLTTKFVLGRLPGRDVDFYFMHDMDFATISSDNTVFSVCFGDFSGITIKNDLCDHSHRGTNDYMFCANVLSQYGQIQRHHGINMINEMLENAESIDICIRD